MKRESSRWTRALRATTSALGSSGPGSPLTRSAVAASIAASTLQTATSSCAAPGYSAVASVSSRAVSTSARRSSAARVAKRLSATDGAASHAAPYLLHHRSARCSDRTDMSSAAACSVQVGGSAPAKIAAVRRSFTRRPIRAYSRSVARFTLPSLPPLCAPKLARQR